VVPCSGDWCCFPILLWDPCFGILFSKWKQKELLTRALLHLLFIQCSSAWLQLNLKWFIKKKQNMINTIRKIKMKKEIRSKGSTGLGEPHVPREEIKIQHIFWIPSLELSGQRERAGSLEVPRNCVSGRLRCSVSRDRKTWRSTQGRRNISILILWKPTALATERCDPQLHGGDGHRRVIVRMAGGSPRLCAAPSWAWLLLPHNNPKM